MTAVAIDPGAWECPLPLRDYPRIVIGHGGGGRLSAELIEHVFLPAFGNPALDALGDASVLALPEGAGRIAFTTDSFVVRPLVFPGGSLGELAVNGTVNDLAMRGATAVIPPWPRAGASGRRFDASPRRRVARARRRCAAGRRPAGSGSA